MPSGGGEAAAKRGNCRQLPSAEIARWLACASVCPDWPLPAIASTLDQPEARPVAGIMPHLQTKTLAPIGAQHTVYLCVE